MPTDPILPRPYFDGKVTTIHVTYRFSNFNHPHVPRLSYFPAFAGSSKRILHCRHFNQVCGLITNVHSKLVISGHDHHLPDFRNIITVNRLKRL